MALKFWAIITICVIYNLLPIVALQCYLCDSSTDPWCQYLQSPADATTQVQCADTISECYHFLSSNGEEIRRGCLDPALITCDSSNGDSCESCSSDLCNSEQLVFEECASCDSDHQWDCLDTSNSTTVLQCFGATIDKAGCYLESDSWVPTVVRRGCVADLNDADFQMCSQNGGTCKICHGDTCNLKEKFQRCAKCDSETDLDCLYQPRDKFKICSDYMDSCASYAIPGGKTARGCLKEIDPEPTFCPSTNCLVCPNTNCNIALVPYNRLQCFQCNSTIDENCMNDQEVNGGTPCEVFHFDDQCYRYYDEVNGISYRGCLKNDPEIASECDLNPEQCSKCTTSNCNDSYLTKKPELVCVSCEREDPACPFYYPEVQLGPLPVGRECQNMVPFYKYEQCYSYQYPDNTVERGCRLDKPEVCEDPIECRLCVPKRCNSSPHISTSCIVCSSNSGLAGRNCDDQSELISPTRCLDYTTYEERGCFAYRDFAGEVHRGCRLSMPQEWDLNCESEYSDRCTKCFGDNCNTEKVGGGGFMITASYHLIGGILGVIMVTNY